ncbi:MAG TPA: hypothetical protein VF970_08275 [Gemmatimonadales bacterium]
MPLPTPRSSGPTRRVLLVAAGLMGGATSATAQFSPWATFPLQYVDARVLPAGALRIGFLPSYANYDERFLSDGTVEALGAGLTTDTAGANLLPTLTGAEQAVRDVTGDSTYRMTLGGMQTLLDADVRRIPLDLALGLTSWLTVTARVSLVKTRMQAFVALDSTQGNVGWNQLTSQADNATGAAQITTLMTQLAAAVQTLQDQINSGAHGCPGTPSCTAASDALSRASALLARLSALTGATSPVAPLSTSPAGLALTPAVSSVLAELAGLCLCTIGGALVLPTKTLTGSDFQTLISAAELGHGLSPIATTDISRIGDTEVGVRIGVVQRPTLRLALHGTARLPTASRDSLTHALDLGTGDRQLDAALGVEAAFEARGGLGLSVGATLTRQFADNVTLRLPRGWVLPLSAEGPFRRDLGDVIQASAYPSLRLSSAFQVFGSLYYYRKSGDTYDYLGPSIPEQPALTTESPERSLHLGAGIHYRADRTGTGTVKLPVEAGLSYQAAFRGSGRMTPKTTILNLYLRLYYRVFGPSPPAD